MAKRGAKPKFADVSCPEQDCTFYGISGKEKHHRQLCLSFCKNLKWNVKEGSGNV